jgi:hypothetical protein
MVSRVALLVALKQSEGGAMSRYLVERLFPRGPIIPINDEGMKEVEGVLEFTRAEGVTWMHSWVATDKRKAVCMDGGPDRGLRGVAAYDGLLVDSMIGVGVFDPISTAEPGRG